MTDTSRSIKFYRVILIVAVFLYGMFALLYRQLPELPDPMPPGQRLLGASIFAGVFLLSYLNSWIKRKIGVISYIAAVLAIGQLIFLAGSTDYLVNFGLSLIVVVPLVNLIFKGDFLALVTNLGLAVTVGFMLFFVEGSLIFRSGYYLIYLTSAGLTFFLSCQKLKVEEELQASENRYRTIFDAAPIGINLKDFNGRILEANPAASEITGYARGELEGRNIFDKLVPEEMVEPVKAKLEKIKAGEVVDYEGKSYNKDGKLYYSRFKETNFALPDGSPGVLSMQIDITKRKKLEERLRLIQFSIDTAEVAVFWLSPGGKIKYVNDKACSKLQYSRDELVGKHISEIDPDYSRVNREEYWRYLCLNEHDRIETRHQTKSGDIFPVQVTSHYQRYQDKEYEFAFAQDITARKQKEEEIKQQKERLDYIIEGTDIGTWEWNVQTGETIFNEKWAEMVGYTLEELEPTTIETWMSFSHPDDLEKSEKMLQRHFQGEIDHYDIELRMQHRDGHWIWVLDRGKVISWTDSGEPLWMFGTHLDITERKEREKKINYLLYRDSLTGLYNRRFFEEELSRLDVERQLPLSLIMADLNGLKIFNDSFGHEKGDELIVKAARILKKSVRQEDIVARWGGDEFIILLPQTSEKEAQDMVFRLQEEFSATEKDEIPISSGLGTASKTEPDENIRDVINQADKAMYQDKLAQNSNLKNIIVNSLLNTLGAKSYETKEHALRIGNLARKLGEKIGLTSAELNRLSLLASLHDIGKTSIPEEILNKPGKLSGDEWEMMRKHPRRGYKIAMESEGFGIIAAEILAHHERWDGQGYPDGLAGEEIPFLARVIAIVDAYDVMTTGRPYQAGVSSEEALTEILRCAGTQFDPDLAREFVQMLNPALVSDTSRFLSEKHEFSRQN